MKGETIVELRETIKLLSKSPEIKTISKAEITEKISNILNIEKLSFTNPRLIDWLRLYNAIKELKKKHIEK